MRPSIVAATVVAFVLGATPALAGELRWSGFYAGVNGGHSLNEVETKDAFLETTGTVFGIGPVLANTRYPSEDSKGRLDGFFGGGQVGYNYQTGAIVIGVEADIQAGDNEDNTTLVATAAGPTYATHAKTDYFGTVRGRLGVVTDGLLVYATGGFAYSKGEGDLSITPGTPAAPVAGGPYSASDSQLHTGWVIGAGAEIPITKSISVKAEYLRIELSEETYRFDLANSNGSFVEANEDVSLDVLRAGLNFSF